ncbi:hypothetical protein HRH25_04055 [Flavisolibacter sp. BT320]|nr:hypothetical protein [Flavisolibacter longurius]
MIRVAAQLVRVRVRIPAASNGKGSLKGKVPKPLPFQLLLVNDLLFLTKPCLAEFKWGFFIPEASSQISFVNDSREEYVNGLSPLTTDHSPLTGKKSICKTSYRILGAILWQNS